MPQIVRRDGILGPQARGFIAEISIAVTATVQNAQGNAVLGHVGYGGGHQLAHIALAAHIGVHADTADSRARQCAVPAGKRERVGADGGNQTAILPHQIMLSFGGGAVCVELWQHPRKIMGPGVHTEHHIGKIADFVQLAGLAACVGDFHTSLPYKIFLGISNIIIFFFRFQWIFK